MIERNQPFQIGTTRLLPGERIAIDLPVTQLYTHSPVAMPVYAIHGRLAGPRLFVSSSVHGDEINGVEIIRRLLAVKALTRLHGTLICIPIVNVFGFLNHTRYLPDRRDLNRSFPGSDTGSLTARTASLFVDEIVRQCTHGIDLHTAAGHRENLPQIRAELKDPETRRLALAFGAPVVIEISGKDGSLRQAATDLGVKMLLYEAGEALRFNELAIRAGVRGILAVMRELGMLRGPGHHVKGERVVVRDTSWVRAPAGGIHSAAVELGTHVEKRAELGTIAGPFGEDPVYVLAPYAGVVIGINKLPLVNEGDALFHLARVAGSKRVKQHVAAFTESVQALEEFQRDIWR
jgi:hypothetical protein